MKKKGEEKQKEVEQKQWDGLWESERREKKKKKRRRSFVWKKERERERAGGDSERE